MADDHVVGGKGRPIQIAPVKKGGWTKTVRTGFLDTLARTCNVRGACAAVERSPHSAYGLRGRDPAFAALWQQALTMGYERLKQLLLSHALTSINAIEIGADDDAVGDQVRPASPGGRIAPGDIQLALALLRRNRGVDVTPYGRTGMSSGLRRSPSLAGA